MSLIFCLMFLFVAASWGQASGSMHSVAYGRTDEGGRLVLAVTYRVWVPDGVKVLGGVIVHQHGCGEGACRGGETAADDLHWQALARKWDCALLGPSFEQRETDDCRLWWDPRNGSNERFLRALADLAEKTGHPELDRVPWCLWGHSGGGLWASLMQILHPERVVAVWLRSGTAYGRWETEAEVSKPEISEAVYGIPVMCNPGLKEKEDQRFGRLYAALVRMFRDYRGHGAPIGFAPDPRTGHECGDSRYLAIPFFDACLKMRLPSPEHSGAALNPVDWDRAWFAPLEGHEARQAKVAGDDVGSLMWMPNEGVARAWMEYVKTGAVSDATPPPGPSKAKAGRLADGSVELTWEAEADFESGLGGFVIRRDGRDLASLPEKPSGRFGRALFQTMSYHDTPERPLPEMRYVDANPAPGRLGRYEIFAVNSVGLVSREAAVCVEETPLARGDGKEADGFTSIFDGKTLDGWRAVPEGSASDWSVRDGVILGRGSADRLSYLVWKGELADFELKLSYRMLTKGNTGIEVRARPDVTGKRPFEGYHADLGHVGIGPRILGAWDFHFAKRKEHPCPRGTRLVINEDETARAETIDGAVRAEEIHKRDWNEVHIIARGNRFRFFINGKPASEFTDNSRKGRLERGWIGLQIHEEGMEVEFRNLHLKR